MFHKVICIFVLGLFTYLPANANSLAGVWQHNNQRTTISTKFNNLVFCNEQGHCADGFYRGARLIVVPGWNVTGTVSHDGRFISWSNGTQWIKNNHPRKSIGCSSISGAWVHQGKSTSIQLRDATYFILINEMGQRTEGIITENRKLFLPRLNVTGRLYKHCSVIEWSNGTTWYRP